MGRMRCISVRAKIGTTGFNSECQLLLAIGKALSFQTSLNEVGALAFGAQLFARGLDAEGLFHRAKAKAPCEAVVEDFEVLVFKFQNFAAIDADEVVVGRAVEKVRVVSRLAVAKVDLVKEVGLGQEGEGTIEGSARGGRALFAKAFEQLFGREVILGGKNELHDGIALGGLPKTFGADEGIEFFANCGRHHGDALISN